MSLPAVAVAIPTRERAEARVVSVVARKVLRESVRDRWFWLYCAGFATLAATLTTVAVPETSVTSTGGFSRTAASLVALVQLVVTLMALTLGARSLAAERESGTLRFLLSHPVSRSEVLLGTWAGLAGALAAAVAAGFGTAGLLGAAQATPADAAVLARIAALSWLLSLAMLGVGMVITVSLHKVGAAIGTALFVWLTFVFLGDLGLMGTVVATDLPVETLLVSVLANPVESFRLAAIVSLDGSLDSLGPAGTYAVDTYGSGIGGIAAVSLAIWVLVPLLVAWITFRRKADL